MPLTHQIRMISFENYFDYYPQQTQSFSSVNALHISGKSWVTSSDNFTLQDDQALIPGYYLCNDPAHEFEVVQMVGVDVWEVVDCVSHPENGHYSV